MDTDRIRVAHVHAPTIKPRAHDCRRQHSSMATAAKKPDFFLYSGPGEAVRYQTLDSRSVERVIADRKADRADVFRPDVAGYRVELHLKDAKEYVVYGFFFPYDHVHYVSNGTPMNGSTEQYAVYAPFHNSRTFKPVVQCYVQKSPPSLRRLCVRMRLNDADMQPKREFYLSDGSAMTDPLPGVNWRMPPPPMELQKEFPRTCWDYDIGVRATVVYANEPLPPPSVIPEDVLGKVAAAVGKKHTRQKKRQVSKGSAAKKQGGKSKHRAKRKVTFQDSDNDED